MFVRSFADFGIMTDLLKYRKPT